MTCVTSFPAAASPEGSSRPPVGFIGIGNMGGAMAARLHQQGWPVWVCDVDPQRCAEAVAWGARAFDTPRALAAALPDRALLIVAVVNGAQCRDAVWGDAEPGSPGWQGDAAVHGLQAGQTVMWCPTLSPDDVEALAQRLHGRGVHSIDAPMSGGPARARAGTMSLMVAGEEGVVARHEAVLHALADPVFRLGERLGDGARTKLVNNLLAGINLVGAAEALALADALGLELGRTLDVIERSSGQSWIGSDRMRRALANDLSPRAHMTLLTKDTRLACEAAVSVGFQGPLATRVSSTFAAASAAGWASFDDAAMLHHLKHLKPNE